MSNSAKTMFYWLSNAASNVADNDNESAYCYDCARLWATAIIAGSY